MTEVVYTLIGVIVGWALNWVQEACTRKHEGQQEAKAVRVMLRREIAGNLRILDNLKAYWPDKGENGGKRRVEDEGGEGYREEIESDYDRLIQFQKEAHPSFSEQVWDALLPRVALSLRDGEADACHSFYQQLGAILEQIQDLNDLRSLDIQWKSSPSPQPSSYEPLLDTGPLRASGGARFRELGVLAMSLLASGNPLKNE